MAFLPRVAILVLNYNGEDCLSQCLTALQQLRYPNFQVVVIDNGSTDNSLEEAKKKFPNNSYLEKKSNTGFGSGMNTGIDYAKQKGFDYVWLMNSDAWMDTGTLDVLIKEIQKNQRLQAVSPVIETPEGKVWYAGGKVNFFRMRVKHITKIKNTSPYKTGFLTGCAPLFSTNALTLIRGFDERFFLYYEDADLSLRLRERGISLHVIPEARVIHAEKSTKNPQKLYFLVFSGLLFFALHTPFWLRPYISFYVTIRVLVNRIKLYLKLFGAEPVAKAYADYTKKFQTGDQLYFRKLPKRSAS